MIDPKLLREQPEVLRASQRARGDDESAVDAALAADTARRAAVTAGDTLRAEQKAEGRGVAQATGQQRQELLARLAELAAAVAEAEAAEAAAEAAAREALLRLGNIVADGVPPGGADDYAELRRVGERPAYDGWGPRDHLELGQLLSAIDVERGAKVSGSRFFFLTGVGALLEMALVNLALAQAVESGFTPVIPPALVLPAAMEGTGYLGEHSGEVYRLVEEDLYLVGTSEVPLAAYHSGETLDPATLPRRYAAFSPCFRREAGSYGKDTRGIVRVHQFDKVEMFSFCTPEQSAEEHERLLGWEEEFLQRLELPYRVIEVAAGDLGASAARKYDCEAWIPTQQRYLEVTSTSNCTDYQARRLGIRTRDSDGRRQPVHTLNGTLVAIPRIVVALLEVHQRPDGTVVLPEALRGQLGREALEPVG